MTPYSDTTSTCKQTITVYFAHERLLYTDECGRDYEEVLFIVGDLYLKIILKDNKIIKITSEGYSDVEYGWEMLEDHYTTRQPIFKY